MSLAKGDVVKVLEDGVHPPDAHPIVILAIVGENAVLSNITDVENEDDDRCVLLPEDDPEIIKFPSTFRFQSIQERPVKIVEAAIASNTLRYCGKLAPKAFTKVIDGSQLPGLNIKRKYKTLLKPLPQRPARPTAPLQPEP